MNPPPSPSPREGLHARPHTGRAACLIRAASRPKARSHPGLSSRTRTELPPRAAAGLKISSPHEAAVGLNVSNLEGTCLPHPPTSNKPSQADARPRGRSQLPACVLGPRGLSRGFWAWRKPSVVSPYPQVQVPEGCSSSLVCLRTRQNETENSLICLTHHSQNTFWLSEQMDGTGTGWTADRSA